MVHSPETPVPGIGAPARERERARLSARSYAFSVLALLGVLCVLQWPRLRGEFAYFGIQDPVNAGIAPVPQDDTATPALDRSLQSIAAMVPRSSSCVIAVDAWRREYFRAAYLLMPRRIWPAVEVPMAQLAPGALARDLTIRHADCLLVLRGSPVPAGLRPVYRASVSLYMSAGQGRVR